jgi:ribonuclease HI
MFFDGSLMKTGAGAGLLFISPLGKHLCYMLRLHFPVSNNVAEYEALVNGLRIAIELGVRRLDACGDSQLVIDRVMKNSHCRDPKMEAYCDEVRRLEDKFYGLELNHIARRYNETADELAKIASGRTTVPPDVFSRDLQVGDLVLRLRQDARGRHKLMPPWEGSFVIAKVLKPGTYKLANSQGEVYSNAWNIRQLRRFYP